MNAATAHAGASEAARFFGPGRASRVAALALWGAVMASGAAQAADTPSEAPPSAPAVNAAEKIASARKAIEAKDWSRAIGELQAAEKVEPKNADVHNLLGYSFRKRATPDLPRAFRHYETALKLDPAHKGAHEYIGEAFLMDGKPAEAERHLARLEALCGNKTCEEYVDLAGAIEAYRKK